MFILNFVRNKLTGFRLRIVTRIKYFYVDFYVEKLPKRRLCYSNFSELTKEQLYILQLEKAGKLRKVTDGMWEFVS